MSTPRVSTGDLLDTLHQKTRWTKRQLHEFSTAFLAEVLEALRTGNSVRLDKLGTFTVREKAAWVARNPATGAKVQVAAKKIIAFKASPGANKEVE